jgi:hypothetical protein
MKNIFRSIVAVLLLIAVMTSAVSCAFLETTPLLQNEEQDGAFYIDSAPEFEMLAGDSLSLRIVRGDDLVGDVVWTSDNACIFVANGNLIALEEGRAVITATLGELSDSVTINVISKNTDSGNTPPDGDDNTNTDDSDEEITSDPYVGVSKDEFYANYTPAKSYMDTYYRTQHGLLSGRLDIPSQAPTVAQNRPKQNGLYVRNTEMRYEDNGNTYVVFDASGEVAFKVYKGGAYITLEEVAAYMFAFGGTDGAFPANYTSAKKTSPTSSIWGKYLRVNHSYFSGDTVKYPREPELPNISGCGGTLQYWEMDIGTSSYNNGTRISRGACRIVYGRRDLNRNGVYEEGELHVFYTYNHYDDFQEYLNYEGGWGERFGYATNGSSSSKGPSPYVSVAYANLCARSVTVIDIYYYVPRKEWLIAA